MALRVAGRARRDDRDRHRRRAFPLYLSNVSTLRIGTSAVFVLIALVWFYVLALIVLAGAVVNELRFERVRRSAGTVDVAGTARCHVSTRRSQHRFRPRGRARIGPMAEAGESVVVGHRAQPTRYARVRPSARRS